LAQAQANPADFETLAKDHSIDPNTASFRGILPPIRRHSGDPNFENIAFGLEPGKISQIIEIPDPAGKTTQQFVILKCERHYPAASISADQQPLIVERLREQLSEQKLAAAATGLFERLQNEVKIVNVYNDPQLRQQNPGVAAMINDVRISLNQLAEECIARFGHEILETEINRQLILHALKAANISVSDQDLQQEIARAAQSYGFPDVEKWIQYVTKNDKSQVDVYVQDEVWPSVAMKKLVESTVQVSDDDMQKGYEANFGVRVECLAIVLGDYNSAKKVWKMATDNPDRNYFGDLAYQYSIEPASKTNRGEVPPIQKHGGRPTLEEEAFKLRAGEISGLVNVGDFWIVLYCLGQTTPVVQDFDAVKDELYNDLLEKKLRIAMDDKFAEMRDSAQIDNFLAGTSQPGRQAAGPAAERTR
jgi:parvulin-like peptidyl-prolyl isomerase